MKRPNPSLFPSGGWFYRHTDGTTIRGTSREDLATQVVEYFIRIGENTDLVDDRIDEFICKVRPTICRHETWIVDSQKETSPKVALAGKVKAYLAKAMKESRMKVNGLPRVSAEVARQRAEICRKCPLNSPWAQTCQVCVESVRHASEQLAKDGPKIDTSGLKGCLAHGFHLPTAVRLAYATETPNAPEQCWRRSI